MGLYTPAILGGNSYLSWFYDRGAIKGPPHTGTSEGLSQAINRRPIRKFLPNYANVYVTIQSHDFSAGAQTHYATANGVRNGLFGPQRAITALTERVHSSPCPIRPAPSLARQPVTAHSTGISPQSHSISQSDGVFSSFFSS